MITNSVRAWLAFTVLGLVSMGALGFGLYLAVYPLLGPFHGNANDWRGDWVWAAMISAGMVWPLSFLAAGWVALRLRRSGRGKVVRTASYLAVLWLGAALAWWLMLATQAPD